MTKHTLNLETDIQPISEFRANTSAALEQVRTSGRPLVLTQRGKSAAVVLEVGAYQALIDEVEALRDVQRALSESAAGKVTHHEDAKVLLLGRLDR